MNVDLGLMPGTWADRAACNGDEFPDAWHPGENAAINVQLTAYAMKKCKGCAVRTACLQFALEAGPRAAQGVWGATTAEQRRTLLKKAA